VRDCDGRRSGLRVSGRQLGFAHLLAALPADPRNGAAVTELTQPSHLHDRVRDGVNAGDVDSLVALYERDAVLMAEDGSRVVGIEAIRSAYELTLSFGGTLTLTTRYVVETGDVALLSNQYTFSLPGYTATWITSEVARRQPDGTWKYVIDNPYAAPGGAR
jgi:ketosteroid isomerase-like protein